MEVISIESLSKFYGEVEAVKDLSLEVKDGELFGFIGPNGAGKTTTIEILTGQLMPSSGDCKVLGVDPVLEPKKVRAKVGILPEREDPPSFMSPREYFSFVGEVRGIENVEDKVDEWAERLKFSDRLDMMNKSLSKGEKQKVMVTQTFLHEPDLVFIDEPLINLDPVIQERLKDFFIDYVERGNTIFLSTHVMSLADEICTHIGVIDEGRLVDTGPIDELELDNEKLSETFLRIVEEQ